MTGLVEVPGSPVLGLDVRHLHKGSVAAQAGERVSLQQHYHARHYHVPVNTGLSPASIIILCRYGSMR
jgi:hypothetical protein